jgi:hypothetical protein
MTDLEWLTRVVEELAKPITMTCVECGAEVRVPEGVGHDETCSKWEGPKDPAARKQWKADRFVAHYFGEPGR